MLDCVIDISHWQPTIDAMVLKSAGVLAIIHKATQISANTGAMLGGIDQTYTKHRAQALAAGLLWGAYAFGDPAWSGSGAAQADLLLKFADGLTLLALDLEHGMELSTAEQFVQHVYDKVGFWPVLYTGFSYLKTVVGTRQTVLSNCDLWIADPNHPTPVLPPQFTTWKLWQHGSRLTPGAGNADRNIWNGGADELSVWWRSVSSHTVSMPPVVQPVTADIFEAPIGDGGLWSPTPVTIPHVWYSANNYLALYTLNGLNTYHTGVDLNQASDSDAHSPVYASANGEIVYAQRVQNSSWGNLIIERCVLPDQSVVYLRYGHVENPIVKAGDIVKRGQQIASVGNAFGAVPYHLHFDVSTSAVLASDPANWPGLDKAALIANYVDPFTFIQSHMGQPSVPAPIVRYVKATAGLHVRDSGSLTARIIGGLPYRAQILVIPNTLTSTGFIQLATQSGWVSNQWLSATDPAPVIVITPTPKPTPTPSASTGGVGPHFLGGQDNSKIAAMRYPVFKSVNDIGSLQAAHAANPFAICIFRNYDTGPMDVEGWIAHQRAYLDAMPWAYHESFNEAGDSDNYLAFEAARARRLHQLGYKACLLNIGVGQSNDSTWQRGKDMVAAALDTDSIIGVHCYAQSMMSANYHASYWDASGDWQGELYPTVIDPDNAWTALRPLNDKRALSRQGQGSAVLVATELGLDDLSMSPGIHCPREGKQRGWRQSWGTWSRLGWTNSSWSPAQFYREQLNWWAKLTGMLGCVFTQGTGGDQQWSPYDTSGDIF